MFTKINLKKILLKKNSFKVKFYAFLLTSFLCVSPGLGRASELGEILDQVLSSKNALLSSSALDTLLAYGVRQNTHIYALTQQIALELGARSQALLIEGSSMRDLSRKFDLGGQDGQAVFASPELLYIRLGQLGQAHKTQIQFYLSKPISVSIKDVPEAYTLRMQRSFAYSEVSEKFLGGIYGFRGGIGIFTLPFKTFEMLPNNKMRMKMAFLPASVVEVHKLKLR